MSRVSPARAGVSDSHFGKSPTARAGESPRPFAAPFATQGKQGKDAESSGRGRLRPTGIVIEEGSKPAPSKLEGATPAPERNGAE